MLSVTKVVLVQEYRRRHRPRRRGDMLSLHSLRSSSNTPETSRRSDNIGLHTVENSLTKENCIFTMLKGLQTLETRLQYPERGVFLIPRSSRERRGPQTITGLAG